MAQIKRIEETRFGVVYAHFFPNGKIYVGQTTTNPQQRWGKDGAGYQYQPLIWKAIKKYGWNNIGHTILESGEWTLQQINEKEQYYIKKFDSFGPNGYNLTKGGVLPAWGAKSVYQIDRETLNIIQEFSTLNEAAEVVGGSVECISQCCNHKIRTANGYCWCFVDDYCPSWQPIEVQIKRKRRIYCLETDRVYESPNQVEQQLGINHIVVSRVCRNKQKNQFTHGYHLCYAEDDRIFEDKIPLCNSAVYCVTTDENFVSLKQACEKYHYSYNSFKKKLNSKDGHVLYQGLVWVKKTRRGKKCL